VNELGDLGIDGRIILKWTILYYPGAIKETIK
jgi:hypothetical protein